MRSIFIMATACAALFAAAAPTTATAQDPRVGQAQVYRSLLTPDMAALLNGMEYASVKKGDERRFDVETRDGFKYSVELTVCDVEDGPQGCLGMNIFATWAMEAGDRVKLEAAVDKFNNQYRIGKALVLEDSLYAERYVITDGGVTLQHLTDELAEFESAMAQFGELMHEALGD